MKRLVFALSIVALSCTEIDDRECIDRCIEKSDPEACYRACMEEREQKLEDDGEDDEESWEMASR